MKIALDWIAEYLSPTPKAEVVADALMNAGLPIESIAEVGGAKGPTQILDVEVTSNRTDCFCHVGLAREIGALTGGNFAMPKIEAAETGDAASVQTTVSIDERAKQACPYYSARLIRNVKVGPSPEWLVKRLESIGLRSINNVVDVTNYVLMELGQPLHAFDFDLLEGKKIIVRNAIRGETMQAIDGKEYALAESMLVIADAKKPVAIAGVMGGKSSEVTEKTTNILLESARFDPLSIRTTSRTLTLKSDSSYRFERGIDPTMAELASKRAAQLILQVGGPTAQIAPGVITDGAIPKRCPEVSMRFDRFEKIVGFTLSQDRAMAILSALGFSVWVDDQAGTKNDILYTRVPSHRLDVDREIDLIEEVIRVYGYRHIPTMDRVSHPVTPEAAEEKAGRAILAAMTEAGFSEAVTVTFVPEAEGAAFVRSGEQLIRTQHAGWKSDVLRPSILPSLLAVRRTNQNVGIADARLFEKAEVIIQMGDAAKEAPRSRRMLSAVAGDLHALTGLLDLLADRLNRAAKLSVQPCELPFFVPGASGEIVLDIGGKKKTVGHVGLITTEIQHRYDLRHAVSGLEIEWDALIEIFQPVRRAAAVPRFPGVTRDLSVVVDEAVRWADVHAAINTAHLAFLEKVDFVTTFRNKQVGDGKKSLTLTLDFRDPSRTLKSEEVDAQVKTVIGLLGEKFAAVLRA